MRHLFKLTIFSFIVLSFLSCKKEEDVQVDDTTTSNTETNTDTDNTGGQSVDFQGKNYYPTTLSTEYTYNSTLYDAYKVEFTGTEDVGGTEYTKAKVTVDNSVSTYKALSNDEGATTISDVPNVGELVLKLIDSSKELNESWIAGTVEVVSSGVVTKTTYTGELTDKLSSFTVNGVVYDDVIEITLTTSIIYELSADYIALVGTEFAALMQENLNAADNTIVQKTYYANNVGMIKQVSADQPSLDLYLESKNF